ncbi:maleylacetate reductase [Phytoactinopolyspora endophytica]|uniref:maleylacetate reductase n=1 Tax=Phytoactinopolyspora endophytica TaxID=1642495 RepID=UPI00101CC25D|nr:maleylacetate reductase [Phytoactinopolyspora endophytica]
MRTWIHTAHPARTVFGAGTVERIRDEVERLDRSRALLLAGHAAAPVAGQVVDLLGPVAVGRFDGAAMHTPVEVTDDALVLLRERAADCVVAVGGGSTTGLAKALAWRTGVDQIIIPTTYSGSEVTPVLGETADGVKTTRSSPAVLPETVLYDVDLTLTLPVHISVTSGFNAMAHAVEALYSAEASPVADVLASHAISRIASALPRVGTDPSDRDARTDMLEGAWMAGTCLGSVSMGLHHKLCHTLGGSFDLPHADTHTVVLPHSLAYNAPAVPDVMARIAGALQDGGRFTANRPSSAGSDLGRDVPALVYDLIATTGGPVSLRELGMAEDDLPKAAQLATATAYPNPRALTSSGVEGLLRQAWRGARPEATPTM